MKKLSKILTPFLLITAFLLVSCKDDVVGPPSALTFDSARFDWTVDTLFGDLNFVSMWAADENNLYMVNLNYAMLHYSNGNIVKYNFSDFAPCFIGGVSNNEVYIGGIISSNGHNRAHLKKWNGATFTDIFINNPENQDVEIRKGAIRNSNDMCFGYKKYVIRYDGNNFYFYPMADTTSFITKMFYNNKSNPSYISDYYDPTFTDTNTYNYLYEYADSSWNLIYSYNGGEYNFIHFSEINGFIYGYGGNRRCLYNFNGKRFTLWMCFDNDIEFVSDGISLSNFMSIFIKGEWQECSYFITEWNGFKWSKEICLSRYVGEGTNMFCVNNNCYFFKFENHYDGITYISRGIRKVKK